MKTGRKVLGFFLALVTAVGLLSGMSLTVWAHDVSGNNNLPWEVSEVNVVGDTTHTGNWGPNSGDGTVIDLRGNSLTVNGTIGINPVGWGDGGCGKITLNDSIGGGRFIINNADVCGLYMYNGYSSTPSEFEINGGTYTYTSSRDNPNYTFAIRGYWGSNETGGGQGVARINGGTITDCSGYAVSTLDSGLYIGGRVFITGNHGGVNENGNVFVKTGRTINITGDLQDSVIGITTETLPTPGNPVVLTNGLSGFGSADNFFSDNPDYEIRANEDGEAVLVSHEHSFSNYELSAEGDAITAICDNSDGRCNLENCSALLKIEANEDGSVSFSGDTDAFNPLPEVRFYATDGNGQKIGEPLDSAPVTEGEYLAEFTFGDQTAHIVYEVSPVASIGTVGYGTLQSAMDAAGNGDTIVLLEDVIQCVTFDKAENESVTLDLNGHRIDGNQEGTVITMPDTNTGTLILDDGSSDAAGVVTGGKTNGNGGGILLSGGTFVLKNGSIEGNTASGNGGGIRVDNNTTFNMEGGLIQGNIASNGGGVALAGAESFFNMSGGEISCNAGYGNTGGVLLEGGEPFHMSGGKIQYNAGKNFGGIGSANASIKVSGTAYVRDNAIFSDIDASNALSKIKSGDDYQLAEGGTPSNVSQVGQGVISVIDELRDGASIGVSYTFSGVYNAANGAAFTTGYNDYNSRDKAGKYFTSDDTNCGIRKNKDGELMFSDSPSHAHDFVYTLSEDKTTITAVCNADGCDLDDGQGGHAAVVTIQAPALTVYGGTESPEAVIVDEDEILEEAVVYYYTATDDDVRGEALSAAPTDAGRYWAEITLGSGDGARTAYVIYVIDKVSIEKASVGGVSLSYGYSGKAYTPTLTVKVNGVTLTEDKDYTVEIKNNKNPGTATITITGEGNYTGTRIKTFEIVKCVSSLVSGRTYQMIPKNNSKNAVGSYSGKMVNNTKVYITDRSSSEATRFKAIKNSDGTWKFINAKCELALAVRQNSSEEGAGTVLYDQTTNEAQNWKLSKKSDNSYAVINAVTGYSIAMSDKSAVKGTKLSMAVSQSDGLQRFYFVETDAVDASFDGTYAFKASKDKAFALNINASSKAEGANVNLYSYSKTNAKKFKAIYSGYGYYRLVNVNSGLVVSVKGNTKKDGANLVQSKWEAQSGQRWKITKNSDGTVTLTNALGTNLHLSGNKTANGTNVIAKKASKSTAQRWYLQ